MAAPLVQSAQVSNSAAATTIAVAFGSNVAAGNLIALHAGDVGAVAISGVADTPVNTYVGVVQNLDPNSHGVGSIEGWYAKNIAPGADTVQANFSAAVVARSIAIAEWAGADVTAPLGQVASANNTGRGGPGYLDPNNREFDRGNCKDVDRRQIFNLTGVVPTPQFQGAMLRRLASG